MGVGEDLAPNKQVLQRVVYRAGGPDVSQEAPLQIRTIFCAALPPPFKKLGERREIGGWVMGILASWFQTTLGINNNSQQ